MSTLNELIQTVRDAASELTARKELDENEIRRGSTRRILLNSSLASHSVAAGCVLRELTSSGHRGIYLNLSNDRMRAGRQMEAWRRAGMGRAPLVMCRATGSSTTLADGFISSEFKVLTLRGTDVLRIIDLGAVNFLVVDGYPPGVTACVGQETIRLIERVESAMSMRGGGVIVHIIDPRFQSAALARIKWMSNLEFNLQMAHSVGGPAGSKPGTAKVMINGNGKARVLKATAMRCRDDKTRSTGIMGLVEQWRRSIAGKTVTTG